jgi:hypothetical protein
LKTLKKLFPRVAKKEEIFASRKVRPEGSHFHIIIAYFYIIVDCVYLEQAQINRGGGAAVPPAGRRSNHADDGSIVTGKCQRAGYQVK